MKKEEGRKGKGRWRKESKELFKEGIVRGMRGGLKKK